MPPITTLHVISCTGGGGPPVFLRQCCHLPASAHPRARVWGEVAGVTPDACCSYLLALRWLNPPRTIRCRVSHAWRLASPVRPLFACHAKPGTAARDTRLRRHRPCAWHAWRPHRLSRASLARLCYACRYWPFASISSSQAPAARHRPALAAPGWVLRCLWRA